MVSYLLIMGLGAMALIRTSLRTKRYDPILVALTASWAGYQLQSIISINQIGLAIWGWILTGAAIAYEKVSLKSLESSESTYPARSRKSKSEDEAKTALVAFCFTIIGLFIVLPPLAADAKWRSAQVVRTVPALETTMKPSYFNPQNSAKYLSNIQALEQSQLFELAHKYALEAVAWNPESFELWKLLYLVKNSTSEEREIALMNLKRLDPLNPDVTSIK